MINNINPNAQIPYGAVKDVIPQEITENLPAQIQNFDTQDAVSQSGFAQALKSVELTPFTFGSMFGIWAGLIGFSNLISKSYQGEWKNTLLGKLGALGDKINNGINKITGKAGVMTTDFAKNVSEGVKNKLPFLTTLTRPECNFAKSMEHGVTSLSANDTRTLLEKIIKEMPESEVASMFGGKDKAQVNKMLAKIAENPKTSAAEIEELVKVLSDNKDRKFNVKLLGKAEELTGKKGGIPGVFKLFSRDVTLGELANKLTSVSQNFLPKAAQQNKTALGKLLPRLQATMHEGLTNGFSGGKLMMVAQAFIFAQALQRAIDAPEGEKVSTFMETMAYDLAFFVTFPLQVKSAHIPGSMKYLGMGSNPADQKKAVEAYRTALNDINKNVNNMSHADYDKAVKELKEMLNKNITTGKNVPLWQKPFKAVGKLFALGLEKPLPYTKDLTGATSGLAKLIKKAGFQTRWAGGIGRFVLALFVVAPFLAGIFARGSHVVFGKPTKSILDEGKEEEKPVEPSKGDTQVQNQDEMLKKYNMTEEEFLKKIQEHPEIIVEVQQDPELFKKFSENPYILLDLLAQKEAQNKGNDSVVQNNPTTKPSLKSPMMEKFISNNGSVNPFERGTSNNTQNASNEITAHTTYKEDDLQKEPLRTYVPNSAPAVQGTLTPEQQKTVFDAMQKAQWAEESANRYLS